MDARRQDLMTALGLLILRLGLGAYLLSHGWGKLLKVIDGDFSFGDPIGLGSGPSLVLAMLAETACALLVMLGLATRLASVPVVLTMVVAAFIVHGSDPWTMGEGRRLFQAGEAASWGSKEPALLFLIPFLCLIFTGAGRLSLDALLWPRWRERRGRTREAVVLDPAERPPV